MSTQRMMTSSPLLNVMVNAVQKAGRAMIRDFGEIEHLQVSRKSLGDFVTTADHRSEKILTEELHKARPDFGFHMEEGGVIQGNDPDSNWIIDPLDGTTNFLHGIPHFAINLALKKKDEIVAGVTYNPITDELYWAEKGGGAFVNQRRIRVSGRRFLDEALLASGTPFGKNGNNDVFLRCFQKLSPVVSGIRRSGSAALDLAYLAAGRLDGILLHNLSIWDMAAGSLMIKEAGGYICDFDGKQNFLSSGQIVAGNEVIFAELKALIGH